MRVKNKRAADTCLKLSGYYEAATNWQGREADGDPALLDSADIAFEDDVCALVQATRLPGITGIRNYKDADGEVFQSKTFII